MLKGKVTYAWTLDSSVIS